MMHNTANRNYNNSSQSSTFFNHSGEKKKLREEIYLEMVYRKLLFEEIKEELGKGYTEQDAENVLQRIIKKHKSDGTFKQILDEYLAAIIADVKAKAGISNVNNPSQN